MLTNLNEVRFLPIASAAHHLVRTSLFVHYNTFKVQNRQMVREEAGRNVPHNSERLPSRQEEKRTNSPSVSLEADRQTDREPDRQIESRTDRQTNKQTIKKDKQTDRQTDRQASSLHNILLPVSNVKYS